MSVACTICGTQTTQHVFRCDEHYRCDTCGTLYGLCFYGTDGLRCQPCRDQQIKSRIESFTGKTNNTDEITCPHCGHVLRDSWEYSSDSDDIECPDCLRTFHYTRVVIVVYSTSKGGCDG